MKRICVLLAALLCLSACGMSDDELLAAAPVASQPPDSWGVTETAAPSPAGTTAETGEASTPVPTPSQAPTPEPEPTPEPTPEPRYESLTELCAETFQILVDGVETRGLWLGENIYLSQSDLSLAFPTLQPQLNRGRARFAWRDGQEMDMGLRVVEANGEGLTPDPVEGCVAFNGDRVEYWLALWNFAGEFRYFWDEDYGTLYLTSRIHKDMIPQGVEVPILMYHAVSDYMWGINSLFVSPSDMRAQIQWLLDNGYDPIFFSDLPHLADYDKPVILTFDDGYDDNYDYLFPILQEFQVKATCFIITGMLGDQYYMTEEEVREMSQSGLVDIQSHTVTHDDLNTLGYGRQEQELSQSLIDLTRITGKIPYVIAYPSGNRDGNTLELAPEYYDFGLDMGGGVWTTKDDYYRIDRVYISRFDTLGEFVDKLT